MYNGMKIDCKHWKKCHIVKGGCCSLGKFGGAPSFGTCILVCKKYKGKQTLDDILLAMPSLTQQAKNLAIAAAKVVKAKIKGEQVIATKRVQANRKKICDSCNRLDKKSGRCSECGCQYKFKLATATEECPIGKWKKSRISKKAK